MKRNGLIATFIYLSLIVLWIYLDWPSFCMLAPNEWGDFLAGTIGPLALLWVVLSFWLQSNELQNSVNALQLQAEELKNSVEQQIALVEVSKTQVDLEVSRREAEEQRLKRNEELAEEEKLNRDAPDFLATFEQVTSSKNKFHYTYMLYNRSGDAREVQMTILNSNDNVRMNPKNIRGVSKGTEIQLDLHSVQPLHKIERLTLQVNSSGAEGTLREQRFTWSGNNIDLADSRVRKHEV